jgi:hypothetical protein
VDVGDVSGIGIRPCEFDAALVAVDAGDVGNKSAETASQRTLPTTDVERALAAGRNGIEDDRVVVQIVVPSVRVVPHQARSTTLSGSGRATTL